MFMRIKFLFFLIVIFAFNAIDAQNNKYIDSLETILEDIEITEHKKDKVLNKLWESTVDNDISYAKEIAEKIIDNAAKIENDTFMALGYNRLGISFSYMTNYEKSKLEYYKALKLYRKINDSLNIGRIYINLGLDYSEQDIMDSTLYYYDKALKNFIPIKDTIQISKTKRYIADTYGKKGYYELGLKKALDAVRLLEKSNNAFEIHMSYFGVASFYHELKDSVAAEKYLRKINTFFEENTNPRWESTAKLRLASLFLNNKEKHDEALELLNKGIELSKSLNFRINIADGLLTKGLLLIRTGKLEEAKGITEEALSFSTKTNINHNISRSLILLGEIAMSQKEYSKSRDYLLKALDVSRNHKLLIQQKDAYQNLTKVSELLKNPNKALDYFKAYKKINDSIFQKERINKVEELKLVYETEKKEAQIALQNEEIKTLNVQAKNDKLTKTLYGSGMFSFIAIAGLLYFGFRQRIKKNKLEREKQEAIYKQEIEFKKKELASQTLHLVQKSTFIQEL
jgi:tetratricopeptide (TPR) repeat protein